MSRGKETSGRANDSVVVLQGEFATNNKIFFVYDLCVRTRSETYDGANT
jgi:hypothetical protein